MQGDDLLENRSRRSERLNAPAPNLSPRAFGSSLQQAATMASPTSLSALSANASAALDRVAKVSLYLWISRLLT